MADPSILEVLESMIPDFDVRDKSKIQGVLGVLYVLEPSSAEATKLRKGLLTELERAITALDGVTSTSIDDFSSDDIKAMVTRLVQLMKK